LQRRHFLGTSLALLASYLAPGGAWADSPESRNINAFNARSPDSVYAALGIEPPGIAARSASLPRMSPRTAPASRWKSRPTCPR